ncbi:hypothetical protein BDV59DRAFT_104332 [Aspergillus ambiguus]|uniref:uncharacterized protein n=1 Tax=Aspergillus ambiguus TaxID=176160 RepID=UPI003CCDD2AC
MFQFGPPDTPQPRHVVSRAADLPRPPATWGAAGPSSSTSGPCPLGATEPAALHGKGLGFGQHADRPYVGTAQERGSRPKIKTQPKAARVMSLHPDGWDGDDRLQSTSPPSSVPSWIGGAPGRSARRGDNVSILRPQDAVTGPDQVNRARRSAVIPRDHTNHHTITVKTRGDERSPAPIDVPPVRPTCSWHLPEMEQSLFSYIPIRLTGPRGIILRYSFTPRSTIEFPPSSLYTTPLLPQSLPLSPNHLDHQPLEPVE